MVQSLNREVEDYPAKLVRNASIRIPQNIRILVRGQHLSTWSERRFIYRGRQYQVSVYQRKAFSNRKKCMVIKVAISRVWHLRLQLPNGSIAHHDAYGGYIRTRSRSFLQTSHLYWRLSPPLLIYHDIKLLWSIDNIYGEASTCYVYTLGRSAQAVQTKQIPYSSYTV